MSLLLLSCSVPQSAVIPGAYVPSPSAYYHTLLALQSEEGGDDSTAQKEYLAALQEDTDSPFLLNQLASLFIRKGLNKDALSYAERAAAFHPNDPEILNTLGMAYLLSGWREKGINAYQKSIRLRPGDMEPYLRLAGAYTEDHDLTKAEETIRAGVNANVDSFLGHYYLGKFAEERREWEEAERYYRKVISLYAGFTPAYFNLAQILEHQERVDEGISIYQDLLKRSENVEAAQQLIRLLVKKGSFDEALDLLHGLKVEPPLLERDIILQEAIIWAEKGEADTAIQKLVPLVVEQPDDLSVKHYLASLYEETKQYEEAIATYKTMLEENKDAYDIRLRLGALYFYKLKNREAALAEKELAIEIYPNRPEAYLFGGMVAMEEKGYEDAAHSFENGLHHNPSDVELHFHLGIAYDKLHRFDDFVAAMEKVIVLAPNHADALNYLGYTYVEREMKLDEAIVMIRRAMEIRPSDGYFIDSLGWAYYKQGRADEALVVLQKAVSIVPDDPVIQEHLGEVYWKNNQPEAARKAWLLSLSLDPSNERLIDRFKKAGFELPPLPPTQNQSSLSQSTLRVSVWNTKAKGYHRYIDSRKVKE